MKKITLQDYISTKTIAKDLDCSSRTVQGWISDGKLKGAKLMGRLLVTRTEYEEWKKRNIIRK